MATRSATGPATTPPETVEQRFRQLEAAWKAATGVLSDDADIVEHPAFREIIGMGAAVVPLMLSDLEQRPRLWVWALPEITGENPVPVADRGNIARMSDAWLRWGRTQLIRDSALGEGQKVTATVHPDDDPVKRLVGLVPWRGDLEAFDRWLNDPDEGL